MYKTVQTDETKSYVMTDRGKRRINAVVIDEAGDITDLVGIKDKAFVATGISVPTDTFQDICNTFMEKIAEKANRPEPPTDLFKMLAEATKIIVLCANLDNWDFARGMTSPVLRKYEVFQKARDFQERYARTV